MFTRESVIASDWYQERLRVKQERDVALWSRHVLSLELFRQSGLPAGTLDVDERLAFARQQLDRVKAPAYLNELKGTIGADPFTGEMPTG